MVLHGRNLIVSANGKAIAAAKSCVIDIQTKEVEVTGPYSGRWEEYRAGRMTWKVNTSGLVGTNGEQTMTVMSHAKVADGYVSDGVDTWYGETYGFQIMTFVIANDILDYEDGFTWDLVHPSSDHFGDAVHDYLDGYPPRDYPTAICINANEPISDLEVWEVIKQAFNISFSNPLTSAVTSFALMSTPESGSAWQMSYSGGEVKVVRYIGEGGSFYTVADVLKESIQRAGQQVTLTVEVSDSQGVSQVLSGTALCRRFQVTGTLGNLAQGNFEFLGNGAPTIG